LKKISDSAYVVDLSSDMTIFKTFNMADLYEYYPTEQLYPDGKSRTSYFKEGEAATGNQNERQPAGWAKTT